MAVVKEGRKGEGRVRGGEVRGGKVRGEWVLVCDLICRKGITTVFDLYYSFLLHGFTHTHAHTQTTHTHTLQQVFMNLK